MICLKIKTEPAFSTYLFAKFDPLEKSLLAINNTRGVRHVVKFGGQLAVVDQSIIDAMHQQFDDLVVFFLIEQNLWIRQVGRSCDGITMLL